MACSVRSSSGRRIRPISTEDVIEAPSSNVRPPLVPLRRGYGGPACPGRRMRGRRQPPGVLADSSGVDHGRDGTIVWLRHRVVAPDYLPVPCRSWTSYAGRRRSVASHPGRSAGRPKDPVNTPPGRRVNAEGPTERAAEPDAGVGTGEVQEARTSAITGAASAQPFLMSTATLSRDRRGPDPCRPPRHRHHAHAPVFHRPAAAEGNGRSGRQPISPRGSREGASWKAASARRP
jgi:hypothetical protein